MEVVATLPELSEWTLHNYSIDFDQVSVKSRSVYFVWRN